MSQLALTELVWMLGEATHHRILPLANGSRAPAAALLQDPFWIAPFHGPATIDNHTAVLTFGQVSILTARGLTLHPRLNDRPELWASLEDPKETSWLIRQEVRIPGVKGWLGLRDPFDDTSGILIQSLGAMVVMPAGDHLAPCHGMLWLSGGVDQPTAIQLELIQLARKQLYQQLVEQSGMSREQQSTTARYLAAHAAEQAPRGRRTPPSSQIQDFQDRLMAALSGPKAESIYIEVNTLDLRRGRRVLQLETRPDGVLIWLNTLNTLTAAALARPQGDLAELLLLEMARRVCVWAEDEDIELDLLEMQRVLVAQRLSQSGGPQDLRSRHRLQRPGEAEVE